jgi:hypothetical protein
MKSIIYFLAALMVLTSCEQVVELDLNSNVSKVVIEGNVTNQPGPYFVKISKSVLLQDKTQPTIDNAIVTISDSKGNIETLESIGKGIYKTKSLQGQPGETYTLVAKVGSESFTAKSTMPILVSLDSIKVIKNTFGGELDFDFVPVYKDPNAYGDIYRFLLSINDTLMKSHFILNDQVENGGINVQPLQNLQDLKLKKGDVVKIQMQKVDNNVGLYYTVLVQNTDSGPGGGTTPANPPSNISNGALGIFSAHTAQEKKAVIPE